MYIYIYIIYIYIYVYIYIYQRYKKNHFILRKRHYVTYTNLAVQPILFVYCERKHDFTNNYRKSYTTKDNI